MSSYNRRQTLGALSGSALNKRQNVKPGLKRQSMATGKVSYSGRPSFGGKFPPAVSRRASNGRQSIGRRKSMANSRMSISRRGSVYGKGSSKMQDPRPIGDKSFLQQHIRVLVTFLTTHQYDFPVSLKSLAAPSRKDFQEIITFIFRQIDPNFSFKEEAFNDEVKLFLQQLGYPFTISKSSLTAVGSPHTWPSLLAALEWLIELVQYDEKIEENEEKLDLDPDEDGEKMFFNYLVEAYQEFLEGEDSYEALELGLKRTFDERNESVLQQIEDFKTIIGDFSNKIEHIKATCPSLSELQRKKNDLLSDRTKFQQLTDKLSKHLTALEMKLNEREVESEARENECKELETEKESLEKQIREQEFSPLEVQRMNQEKQMLEDNQSSLKKQKEEVENKIWNLEMNMCKKIEEVEKIVNSFNEKAAQVQLIPSSAKYAGGLDFELKLNVHAETSDKMVSIDLKGVMKPALMRLREKFQDSIRTANEELREIKEKAEHLRFLKGEKTDEVEDLKNRLKKLQSTYVQDRETMNKELKDCVNQVEDIELELHRLQNGAKHELSMSEKALQQIEYEYNQYKEISKEEIDSLHDEIIKVLDEVSQHKENVQQILSGVESSVMEVKENIVN